MQSREEGPVRLAVGDRVINVTSPSKGVHLERALGVMGEDLLGQLVGSNVCVLWADLELSGAGTERPSESLQATPGGGHANGRVLAPELLITLQVDVLEERNGRTTSVDYSVHLQLVDLASRYVVFDTRVVLPKTFTRGFFS
jgi:hypothetical protein